MPNPLYTLIIYPSEDGRDYKGKIVGVHHKSLHAESLERLEEKARSILCYRNSKIIEQTQPLFITTPLLPTKPLPLVEPKPDSELIEILRTDEASLYNCLAGIIKAIINGFIIINGGAIVALITFYGFFIEDKSSSVDIGVFAKNISHFGWSLFTTAVFATFCYMAYFIQLDEVHDLYHRIITRAKGVRNQSVLKKPIGLDKPKKTWAGFRVFGVLQACALLFLILSVYFFYNGCEASVNTLTASIRHVGISDEVNDAEAPSDAHVQASKPQGELTSSMTPGEPLPESNPNPEGNPTED